MRFAIAAADAYLSVFEAFVNAGWQPLKLFTVPVDNVIHHNRSVVALATKLNIDIQLSRITTQNLAELQRLGCDVLIVASYDWHIDEWQAYLRYAVNFHPSPLPQARGPAPLSQAILEGRKSWGVTCHKLAPKFDSGDILVQETFPLSADECFESLSLRVQLSAARLAQRVARDLPQLWNSAAPQTAGSYWRRLSDKDRLMNFDRPVADILRQVRAFGMQECIAEINGTRIFVRRCVGWAESHAHLPGSVIHINVHARTIIMAARDGFIGCVEWSLVARDQLANIEG